MAKGDDALRRKRNKVNRKRMRNSESSVSSRVASIIAAKRRRKSGKRRICEGMCFSLPTPDDPFREKQEKKCMVKKKKNKSKKQKLNRRENELLEKPVLKTECKGQDDGFDDGSISKFFVFCLKAVEDAWVEEGKISKDKDGDLLTSSWGADFCRVFSAGSSIVDVSEASATRAQVAWLVSISADMIAMKEKQGVLVASPFLLFLVPSQDRAVEVRSLCKPLKALGVHSVSLHPGTSLDQQVLGLKSCEPEFLVSTPQRLLELVSLNAIDISGTSILVIDGLRKFIDFGFLDSLKSIRERISGDPQIITFSDNYGEVSMTVLLEDLIIRSVYWLSSLELVPSLSTFVSQYTHFYTSEEENLSEIIQILSQAFSKQRAQSSKILLVSGSACKADPLASYLKSKGYAICGDSHMCGSHKTEREKSGAVFLKDLDNLQGLDMAKMEIVIIVDFPSIEEYIAILTKVARHTLTGVLHSFISTENICLVPSLIKLLEQCGQVVPEFLRALNSSNPAD